MTNIVEYIVNMRGNLSQQVASADIHVNKLEGSITRAKASSMAFGGAFSMALGVGMVGLGIAVSKMVSAGTTVEDATTGLTTALGDVNAAARVVKNTMEDATKTPFSFEGLLAGNRALISAGESAEVARETVLNLGNAVAGAGKGNVEFERMIFNLQQIKTTGQASAMDIKQFGIAGINIYEMLARSTGKTKTEVKDMKISYEMLQKALKDAGREGGVYANAMGNMSENTSVKLSNVGDTFFRMFAGLFEKLKPLIDPILDLTIKFLGKIEAWVSTLDFSGIASNLTVYFQYAKDVAMGFFQPISDFISSITDDSGKWGGYISIVTDLFQNTLLPYAQHIFRVVFDIVGQIVEFVKRSELVKDIFWGIINVVKNVYAIIEGVLDGIKWAFDNVIMPIFNTIEKVYRFIKGLKQEEKKHGGATSGWGDEESEGTKKKKANTAPKNKQTPLPTGNPIKSKAEGSKNLNITVTYNAPLIKEFTISTTNIKEGLASLKEKVSEILVGATHDTLLIADH